MTKKKKKLVDVTERILESSVVTGRLKSYEWMMKTNKESYIWEGREGNEGATKAVKVSKERNRYAEEADRKY